MKHREFYGRSPIRLTKKEAEKLLYTGKGKDIKYLTWKEDFEIVRYENNIKPAKKTGIKIIINELLPN